MTEVEISGVTIEAEVASTTEELYEGLSSKESLGDNEGMLFDWPHEQKHGLVMRNMSFPIDTIFLSESGVVVHTATLERDGAETTARSKYALEVPAGFCDEHNVGTGDTASFEIERELSKQDRVEKPFAGHEDFSACTEANSDKEDPEAYCAQIHYNATGEWPAEKSGRPDEHKLGPGMYGPSLRMEEGELWCSEEREVYEVDDPTAKYDCPGCRKEIDGVELQADTNEKRIETAARSVLSRLFKTPEGVPDNADYLEPDEEPGSGMETVEGPQGGTYAYDPEEETTDEQEDDGEYSDNDTEIVQGEQRLDIDSVDEAVDAIDEFEQIEEESQFDQWEQDGEFTEGSYVEVQTGDFQLPGDGVDGVIIEDGDTPEVVTENGERFEVADNFFDAEEGQRNLLATWNDPANRIATGQSDWEDESNEYLPEGAPEEPDEEDEEPEEDTEPSWASENPESRITGSEPPEGGLEEGLFIQEDGFVELEEDTDYEGDVTVYEPQDDSNKRYSEIDGTLNLVENGNDIRTGEYQYVDFSDESEYESGWYEAKDDYTQFDEDDENSIGFELYSEEHGTVGVEAKDAIDQIEGVHQPQENTVNTESFETPPEPSGSKDPSDWNIDWSETAEGRSGDSLTTTQKQLLMREWKAAVDDEAYESVSDTIRSVKDSTYNTNGQKYDRLIQAVMDASGEPRSGDFDDAEEPTEAEVEAMRVFQEASREFFDQQYGESKDIHRGLADYSHERVLPQIQQVFESDENLGDKQVELEDNPASVWSTEKSAANTFTVVGGTSKSIVADESVGQEDVFAMPDAIYPYEEREEVAGEDSDWDEGEINIPGNGRELDPDELRVVNPEEIKDDGTIHQSSLADVVDNPKKVIENGNAGAVARFIKTLDGLGDDSFYEEYVEQLRSDDEVTDMDGWEMVEDQLGSIEYDPNENLLFDSMSKQDDVDDVITIDFANEQDSNWMKNEGTTKQKILRSFRSVLKTPGDVPDDADYLPPDKEPPDDVQVHEGPGGGTYITLPEEDGEDAESGEETDTDSTDESDVKWTPHIGSKGHEGWVSSEGRHVDSKRPPGQVVESPDELTDEMKDTMTSMGFYDEVDEGILDAVQREIDNADSPAFETPDEDEEWMAIGGLPEGMGDIDEGSVVQYRGEQYKVDEIREEAGSTVWVGESPDGREQMKRVDDPRNKVLQDPDAIPEYPELDGEWVPAADEFGQFNGWENVETGEFERTTTPPGDPVMDVESIPDEVVFEMSDRAGFGTNQDEVREEMRESIQQIERFEEYGQSVVEGVEDTHLDLEEDIAVYDPDVDDVEPGDTVVTESGHTSAVKDVTEDGVIAERISTGYSDKRSTEVEAVAIVNDVDLSPDTTTEEVAKHLKSRVDNVGDIDQSGFRESKMNELVSDEVGKMLESGVSGGAIFSGLQEATSLNNIQTSNYIDSQTARTELDLDAVEGTVEFFAQGDEMDSQLVKLGKSFGEQNPEMADFASETFEDSNGRETSLEDAVDTWSFENAMEGAAPMWKVAVEKFGASPEDVPDRVFGQGLDEEDELPEIPDEAMEKIEAYVDYQQEMLREVFGDEIPVYRGIEGDYPKQMKQDAEQEGEATLDHRAIESWSLSPTQASGFAETREESDGEGAVVETSVPVENVLLSGLDNVGLESELEVVAFKEDGSYEKLGEEDLDSEEQNDGVYFTSEIGEEEQNGGRRSKLSPHQAMADKSAELYRRIS